MNPLPLALPPFIALAGLLTPLPAAQAAAPAAALEAAIELHSPDGLQRLPLPLTALQHTKRPDWVDVRIVDADGRPVPQAWAGAPVLAASTRWVNLPLFRWPVDPDGTAHPATQVRIQLDSSGGVLRIDGKGQGAPAPEPGQHPSERAWLLDLHGWPSTPRTLRLHWQGPEEGLRRQIRVERSDDTQIWEPAGEATMLDAPGSGGRAIVRREVRLSEAVSAAPRYLRVLADGPLRLQRVEAEMVEPPPGAPMQQARFDATPESDADPSADAPARKGPAGAAWVLDLGGPLPLRQMQVHLATGNSVLPLEVWWRQQSNQPWRFAAQHVAFNLKRDGRASVSPVFDLHAPPARYWRLVTTGATDAAAAGAEPGQALAISVHWQAPQLVFAAGSRPPLKLLAGVREAEAVTLPLFTLIPGYRSGAEYELPQASVGEMSTHALDIGLGGLPASALKRWLLWAVLATAVAGLALMAKRLLNDMRQAPAKSDTGAGAGPADAEAR